MHPLVSSSAMKTRGEWSPFAFGSHASLVYIFNVIAFYDTATRKIVTSSSIHPVYKTLRLFFLRCSFI